MVFSTSKAFKYAFSTQPGLLPSKVEREFKKLHVHLDRQNWNWPQKFCIYSNCEQQTTIKPIKDTPPPPVLFFNNAALFYLTKMSWKGLATCSLT